MNAVDGKVYCIPDGYEVVDKSLEAGYPTGPSQVNSLLARISNTTWSHSLMRRTRAFSACSFFAVLWTPFGGDSGFWHGDVGSFASRYRCF